MGYNAELLLPIHIVEPDVNAPANTIVTSDKAIEYELQLDFTVIFIFLVTLDHCQALAIRLCRTFERTIMDNVIPVEIFSTMPGGKPLNEQRPIL